MFVLETSLHVRAVGPPVSYTVCTDSRGTVRISLSLQHVVLQPDNKAKITQEVPNVAISFLPETQ